MAANEDALQGISIYGKIKERLSEFEDRSPYWYEITNALTERNDKGEFASVHGVFVSYFDKKGLARNVERVKTGGMPQTPKISFEEVHVDIDPDDEDKLLIQYISTDKDGEVSVEVENTEKLYSFYTPGDYVAVSFEFSQMQKRGERQLFNALEGYYAELKKIEESENKENVQIPILTITMVPLLFGGRYSISATDPFIWELIDNEDGDIDESPYDKTLVVIFNRENVSFLADEDIDPAETFIRCKSELASEWLREEHVKRLKEEEKAYKKHREEEIAKLTNRAIKHTFTASKLEKDEEKNE